jgi:hypothetical protein
LLAVQPKFVDENARGVTTTKKEEKFCFLFYSRPSKSECSKQKQKSKAALSCV